MYAEFHRLDLKIRPSQRLGPRALRLALAHKPGFYDSLCLALAIEQDCAVITADRRFHDAVSGSPLASHVRWIGEDR